MYYVYNKVNNLVISKLNYEPNVNSESYGYVKLDDDKDFIIADGVDTNTNLPIIKRLKYNGKLYYE